MKLSTKIFLAFAVILTLSIIDSGANYLLSLKVAENTRFLNKSREIIRNSGSLHKSMIEMQSSMRGFLLTDDPGFLADYSEGLNNIPPLVEEQRKLIENNHAQRAILDTINYLHFQWIGYSNTLIEARKKITAGPSQDSYADLFENKFRKQVGKKINDEISQLFAEFDKVEYGIRRVYSDNLQKSIDSTHTISFILFVLTVVMGIAITSFIVFSVSKRIRTMVELAENISKGKFATIQDTHRDELTGLSTSLNIMSVNLERNIADLEKRNAELDKFAYVVSHDLKAPLRGIHNAMKWINEDLGNELSPELKKYLGIIPQRTKRMEELINGLLDYARIREHTVPEKTDVNELVKEIVETIVPRHFSVEIKDLPVIITEKLKLQQVFTNLISNSVKHSQNENAEINIGCSEHNNHYEFSVRDNGIGIEPEYHGKIFEIFQTLREKGEQESTGVGLAIVKKILDDKHCTIRVNSRLGSGAEFIFTWSKN